jgi:hypothetical protein
MCDAPFVTLNQLILMAFFEDICSSVMVLACYVQHKILLGLVTGLAIAFNSVLPGECCFCDYLGERNPMGSVAALPGIVWLIAGRGSCSLRLEAHAHCPRGVILHQEQHLSAPSWC